MTPREKWKKAREELDIIEDARRRILAPTEAMYQKAVAALAEAEEESGVLIGLCEGCGEPIFDGERHHGGFDVYLCEPCAPSYDDMVRHPELFLDPDGDGVMTKDAAQAIASSHIAGGGKITDKVVWP